MNIVERLVSGYPQGDVSPQDFIDHLSIGAEGWIGAWVAFCLSIEVRASVHNKSQTIINMKRIIRTSALVLTGALLMTACENKEQKTEANVNENPEKEKVEVKAVEGRKNFSDKAVITPLPAIMIATWDENENPDVMMAAWGGQCGPKHITFELSAHKTTDNIRLKKAFTISFATKDDIAQSDYFGIVSGNDVPDKVAKVGFTIT